jgi:hypothetical protein
MICDLARFLEEWFNDIARDIDRWLKRGTSEPARVDPADFDALDDYFFGDTEGSKRAEEAWERISAVLEPAPPTLKGEDERG